jgi:lysophospholipase L1-like esterase
VPAGTGGTVGFGGSSVATGGARGGATVGGGASAAGGTAAAGGSANGGSAATGGRSATGGVASTGGAAGGSDAGIRDGGVGDAGKGGAAGADAGGTSTGGAGGAGTGNITLWMAGDSTMATGSATSCPVGWGGKFQAYFNSNAKVVNSAVGGTTLRSWLYNVTSTMGADGDCTLSSTAPQAHWTAMVDGMKAGDYLFVQFGINDTTAATCPKHVSLATFNQLLGMMAQAAKDKGANPIFLTSVSSISCNGATAQGTRGAFATATRDAGTQYNVPVIDLEQLSVAFYTASGFCPMGADTTATFTANTPVGNFFCDDHTHFEAAGAIQIAGLVAKAIKDQGFALASYLLP